VMMMMIMMKMMMMMMTVSFGNKPTQPCTRTFAMH
jgi:hypothetical protein